MSESADLGRLCRRGHVLAFSKHSGQDMNDPEWRPRKPTQHYKITQDSDRYVFDLSELHIKASSVPTPDSSASCIQGGVWGSMLSKEPRNNRAVETGNLVEDPASRSATTHRADRGASNAHQSLAQHCCTDLSQPIQCQSYALCQSLIPPFAILFAGFPMVS